MRFLFRMVLALFVIAGLALAAWLNRDQLERVWRSARVEVTNPQPDPRAAPDTQASTTNQPEITPEIAERAQQKLEALETGDHDRIALAEDEVQSLIRFRYVQLLPAFVDSPHVALENGRLRLRARLPIDKLPRVGELRQIALLLPDTAEVSVVGVVLPLDSGRVALAFDEVSAAGIPLPNRIVPAVLTRLGRQDEPGVPADAVGVPLPHGAASAYVRRDSLVLVSYRIPRPGN